MLEGEPQVDKQESQSTQEIKSTSKPSVTASELANAIRDKMKQGGTINLTFNNA